MSNLTGTNVLTGNTAAGNGGAIYNIGTLNLTSAFTGNQAVYGGALFNCAMSTLNNTIFDANTANDGSGGAIYNGGGTLNITGCTFTQNVATKGGTIFNDGGTSTETSNTYTGNTAITG